MRICFNSSLSHKVAPINRTIAAQFCRLRFLTNNFFRWAMKMPPALISEWIGGIQQPT